MAQLLAKMCYPSFFSHKNLVYLKLGKKDGSDEYSTLHRTSCIVWAMAELLAKMRYASFYSHKDCLYLKLGSDEFSTLHHNSCIAFWFDPPQVMLDYKRGFGVKARVL